MVKVKNRRFLSSDYDFIGEFIEKEIGIRKGLKFRTEHEILWTEVDRQVRMKAMERTVKDPEMDWRSALELGDLSTAREVLCADALRLIFPQDRSWMQAHVNIEEDRLQARQVVTNQPPLNKKKLSELQKKVDGELRAMMTQQHTDFGFRTRVEASCSEALTHGSFAAEVVWEEIQEYAIGGVFKSAAAPVWNPHSMWNAYPETINLNASLIYTGSMIFTWEKTYEWVLNQTDYINVGKFQDATKDKKAPVELKTYYGDITVERKGDDVFLPNMKFVVANKTVLYAKPNNTTQIIYGGYDRVDIRDPYYLSPLVKQSPNHKISTIVANRFLDNVELKLDPPASYDGNDPNLIAQGGPKIIPGHMSATKGGAQKINFMDVGEPSWAIQAIGFFKSETQEGTGVSSPRSGAQRQADRVTATQIEQESQGAEIRTVDFVGKMEKGIRAYLYIQHEMNKQKLVKYKFYNPEMGSKDFEVLTKADLPKEVHFEVVGSKGVLTERRRMQATSETTAFLLSNERTAGAVNVEAVAKQMYQDAGYKNPEKLLNIQDENDAVQKAIQDVQAKAEQVIQQMQQETQKVGQDLVSTKMELKNSQDQLKLRNERANGTETFLRNEIKNLKDMYQQQMEMLASLSKIKDATDEMEDKQKELEWNDKVVKIQHKEKDIVVQPESKPPVAVILPKENVTWLVERDENGDMTKVVPEHSTAPKTVEQTK